MIRDEIAIVEAGLEEMKATRPPGSLPENEWT
jgi:hypothetical protein